MLRVFALAAVVLAPTGALADKAAADSCAAGLTKEAKVIYDAALPGATPGASLQDLLTAQTRNLVVAGKVQRSSARDSATSAGGCLQKLH